MSLSDPEVQAKARAARKAKQATRKAADLKVTTDLVQTVVDRKRGYVSQGDIRALAKVTGVKKIDLLPIVEKAKETFSAAALEYVNIHKQAAEGALAEKDFETAGKLSWQAIEKISHKGVRIVDKEQPSADHGTKVIIGLQLGGENPNYIATTTVSPDDKPVS